jgi:hypothetical protein
MEGCQELIPKHQGDSDERCDASLERKDLVGATIKDGQTSGNHLRSVDRLRFGVEG